MKEDKIIENIIKKSQMKIAVSEFAKEKKEMPKINKISKYVNALSSVVLLKIASNKIGIDTTLIGFFLDCVFKIKIFANLSEF